MAATFIIVGAALMVAGTAWLSVPAALIVAGFLVLVAGVDLRPRGDV